MLKKAEKLKFILSEEQELGLEPTVTQEQIDECLQRAEKIKEAIQESNASEDYLIYKEEIEEESLSFKK